MALRVDRQAPGSSCRTVQDLEESMQSQNRHALVIGDAIAGPALALLLMKARMSSAIYEARQHLEDVGGGFTIAPNGMTYSKKLASLTRSPTAGAKVSEFCFRNQRGKVRARHGAGNVDKYRWPSIATSRTVLQRILINEVPGKASRLRITSA
jgi:2-polyprenyl-6-methoxyphenol hydroxylase-like FAD-dependent oxidoreductase